MTALKLMPDSRQSQLIKAAKDCVSLMNVGAEPNEALYKIAEDNSLNDNEVVLVSHAVNNGALLSHLQDADEDKRGDSFPLTNAKVVIERREKELRTPKSTEASEDKPDALDIKDEVTKEASFIERTTYRKVASVSVDDVREALGIAKAAELQAAELDHPLAKEQAIKHAMDEASLTYSQNYSKAAAIVDQLCEKFTYVTAPKFAAFEEAALACGVSKDLVDLIYTNGALEGIGQGRMTKAASTGTVIVNRALAPLVEDCVRADTFMKEASDALVELEQLSQKFAAEDKKAPGYDPSAWMVPSATVDFSPKMDQVADAGKAPMDLLSSEPVNAATALGQSLIGAPKETTSEPSLDTGVAQNLENIDTASEIRELMNDDYIKGHSIGEVVDAYNEARSVNPSFSTAELKAYLRQHLASQGAMPLDLMIRARQKGQGDAK